MLRITFFASLVMTLTLNAGPIVAQESPVLDRQLFFGNPQISGGQLSPDGKLISFMKAWNGILNVWVKKFDEPFESARPITDSQRPLYGYAWSDDGKYILYAKDKDGDENINVFVVDPHQPVKPGEIPESRNLTPLDEVAAQISHVSQKNPDRIWVSLNDRDKAWHDLYEVSIPSGERKLVYENKDRITGYQFDWDDNLRLLTRTDEDGTTTILRKDKDKLVPIYETSVSEGSSVLGWDKDNRKFYLETNKGDLNLSTLFLMDPETKEMTLLESDPENRVDFGSLSLDQNTREIISTTYVDDRERIYWKNMKWEANYNFLKEKFPGREIAFQSSTKDYSKFLVAVAGDRYAADAWFFDAETRELVHQYTPRPELKEVEKFLAPMTAVRYKSSDGLEIPGYLTIPAGSDGKNLPLVVLVHGGPKGPRDNWGYDPEAQFLANRGYAVLQPNFRASGGYGKAFLNAGDRQWGKLMQDDITWGVKYLAQTGVADKTRVCIMGGSYGGYATLAGLAFTPDVYACGVDIVGPSNIFTLLDSIPPYWEPAKAFLHAMVGDPATEEGKTLIREASPLFSADKINKPLLIIQGANDPRVKQAEADQIVVALRDKGHDVSYLLAGDEGHGFAKPVNRMAMYAEIERFLADKLGGRYQKEMPEDVAKRLEELKVDVSNVTYTPAGSFSAAKSLPGLVSRAAAEGKEEWKVTIEAQGQKFGMTTTRTWSTDKDGNHLVSDVSEGPLGRLADSGTYDSKWNPVSRQLDMAGQEIGAKFDSEKVVIDLSGNTSELAYSGALLCDGPARDFMISGLPLEKGYELIVNMVDIPSQKIALHRLKVESIEDQDGMKLCEVSITHLDNPSQKTLIWLDAISGTCQRSEQVMPALGNAKLIMERVK
jgi:dipeptidyl aminopeptidase/acylaminoacyl peptidase